MLNFLKNLYNFSRSKEHTLAFEFAFLTGITILGMIVAMGIYINMAISSMNEKAMFQAEALQSSLSATILSVIEPALESSSYNDINDIVLHMISNRVLAYIIITETKNDSLIYSTMPVDSFIIKSGYIVPAVGKNSTLKNSRYLKSYRGNKTIFVGFYENSIFKESVEKIIKQTPYLVLAFMLAGFLLSFRLSRKITSPLGSLIKVTSEFERGDLSNRMEATPYTEINELVMSYNSMADTLQRLYSTLESKVQDRTKKLEVAYDELQNTQAMMVHSEKMKSLGELVAGIMHEINNPINFIYGNMSHLANYSKDLINVIDVYSGYSTDLTPEHLKEVDGLKKEIDYEFLKSDLPDLIRSCREGAERAKNIILDLKDFSRMEEVALSSIDIPKEMDTTLNILHNKMKNNITVHKEYQENLPKLEAFGGQLNQVFMNVLDNASYAIKDKGDIWIRLKSFDNNVIIEVEDNGIGMDEVALNKIFNPFFTTKPVGQGTGLGMSISYKVIKNHQGDIKIESEVGKGTKFTITLPLNLSRELMILAEKQKNEIINEFEIIE